MVSPRAQRFRDPLSPRPVLDRAALLRVLKAEGIALKPGQLDAFYQLLHRRGYPPLEELARELSMEAGAGGDRRGEGGAGAVVPFRTKNAVSGRPGKRAQLPRAFLSYLVATEEFATVTSSVKSQHTSADGTTTKLAVQLQDGHVVESVLMRHGGRVTICVSSQVRTTNQRCQFQFFGMSTHNCWFASLGGMQHGVHVLCHGHHGNSGGPILRRDPGTAGPRQ